LYHDFEKPAHQEIPTMPEEPFAVVPSATESFDENMGGNNHLLYKNRYIITGGKSGLMLIDKQRAHIRVLFEQFMGQLTSHHGVSQQLLFPEILELNASDTIALQSALPELQCVGLDIVLFGKNTFAINGIPSGFEGKAILPIVENIIDCIKNKETSNLKAILHENIALTLAKAAAVSNGQPMTADEMNHLVGQLFTCSNPNLTPDGKRIVVILNNEEIEKKF
jgi:DNA mismatch repair protein MutL